MSEQGYNQSGGPHNEMEQALTEQGYQQSGWRDDRIKRHFVPDEICIVTSVTGEFQPEDIYRRVTTTLNQSIPGWLAHARQRLADAEKRSATTDQPRNAAQPAGQDVPAPLLQDLIPDPLQRRFDSVQNAASASQLLQPLERPDGAAGKSWVSLRATGSSAEVLCYYHIGGGLAADAATKNSHAPEVLRAEFDRFEVVRGLVNLINEHIASAPADEARAVAGAAADPPTHLAAATPNWLAIAANGLPGGGGGPGGRPVAVRKGMEPRQGDPRLYGSAYVDEQLLSSPLDAESGVIVAILDTCPLAAEVRDAAKLYKNWLMQDVSSSKLVSIDESPSLPAAVLSHLSEYRPDWRGSNAVPQPTLIRDDFLMPDHGLFSAGIIHYLAPRAKIHLIRVLDDCGVADLHAVSAVLRKLPDKFPRRPDQRLIVNLSLGFSLPLVEDKGATMLPATSRDAAAANHPLTKQLLELMHQSLQAAVDFVVAKGALVVAATGNDAFLLPSGRKQPRFPARYDNVLGVAATNTRSGMANYSNRGDEPKPSKLNGVATFAGSVKDPAPRVPGTSLEIPVADPGDAVIGIYSSPKLPLSKPFAGDPELGLDNQNGWVYWVGTSFATPKISAVAANLWYQDLARRKSRRVRTAKQLIRAVGKLGKAPGGGTLGASPDDPDVPVI